MAIEYRWDDPRPMATSVEKRSMKNGQIVISYTITAPRDAEGFKVKWATPYLSEGDNPHVRLARKNKYYKG
jgi:hypothetical protein